MRMVDFIKGLLDSILSGSLERMRIINAMNNSFKEAYYSGELERLCKTSITIGDSNFAHEMSTFSYCIYNHRTTKTNQKYPSVNL